jgi:hypothetical protein
MLLYQKIQEFLLCAKPCKSLLIIGMLHHITRYNNENMFSSDASVHAFMQVAYISR